MPVNSTHPISLADLQSRVRSIEDSALELASALEQTAAQIDAQGDLPDESAAQRIESLLSDAESLARLLADECNETSLPETIPSTSGLRATVERIGDIRRQRKQLARKAARARAVLESAASLQHVDDGSFAPLQTSRALAQECLGRMDSTSRDSLPEETDALISGTHPLAALLALVQGGSHLDDARWAELQDVVMSEFGRTLATAVARGRILVGRPLPPDDSAEPVEDSE